MNQCKSVATLLKDWKMGTDTNTQGSVIFNYQNTVKVTKTAE